LLLITFNFEFLILNLRTENIVFYLYIMPLAQVTVPTEPDIEAVENTAFLFNGPQFFAALIAGVVLAFAFQLLFTNLGVAAGISLIGRRSDSISSEYDDSGFGSTVKKVGTVVGIGTLISVTLALFIASILAVKLGLFVSPVSGAIVGLVIWATFFSLMMLFSSRFVGSLLGSVASTATSGMQAILGTATAAFGAGAASKEVVKTAEAAAAAVRKELGLAIDPVSMRENVEEFLQSVKPAGIDVERIARDFEQLLREENLQEIVDSESVHNLDRQTFVDLISDRSDLSKKDIERIANQLESVWQKNTGNYKPSSNPVNNLANYLKTATREQLAGTELGSKLDSLVKEMGTDKRSQGINPLTQVATLGLNSLVGIVMGRTDLSDLDVDKITDRLEKLGEHFGEQTNQVASTLGLPATSTTTIKKDLKNYLLSAYPWQLQEENLDREFRDLIYDPAADPQAIANDLQQIRRADFVEILQQKGILTQDKIRSIADLLETIRLEVLNTADAAIAREKNLELIAEVEDYLTFTPKEELTPEKIQLNFKPILEDFDTSYEQLNTRLIILDRPTLERMLALRGDLSEFEIAAIAGELLITRDLVLENAQQNFAQAKTVSERQWLQIQSYLKDTGKGELNPEGIKQELELLFQDPQAGSSALKSRLAQFDRDTLVQLLAQRQDLSEAQIEEAIDTVESYWMRITHLPQKLAGQAQAQYEQVTSAIADYLRRTGKPELSPEGIQRDLNLLLQDPKLGSKAIRQRLATMDRDTLVQLLAQRRDLNENEVNRIIDDVQFNLRTIAKAPRRLAIRTQKKVQNFQTAIADYLRSTDKAELSPTGIKRDIQLLLNDPRAGAESLKERLAHFDRDTLVALLSQRDDISEADVNKVVDQILEVRDSVLGQLQIIQDKIKSTIDRLLGKIRAYLNSLDRPELSYEGIKRDIKSLFDDPQAGFNALKDRFSQVDRNTLIAIMSSREDISQADAERIVSQIERTRDRTLQRAERIQTEAAMRLESARNYAANQMEETRKAAATASWWLFFTALTSAIASAIAGALSVS
jgi:nucleoid DNA-binding protein